MSIINDVKNDLAVDISVTRAKTRADSLKAMTVGIYDNMVNTFNQGSLMFWDSQDATPQEIANQLGTNASGIFHLHARLGELLAMVDQESVQLGLSKVGQFTQNEDGTITVIQSSGE
jgi:hypothetical protein